MQTDKRCATQLTRDISPARRARTLGTNASAMEELVDQIARPAPLLDPSDSASDRILSARSSSDVPSFSRLSLVDQEPAAVPNGKGMGKGKGKGKGRGRGRGKGKGRGRGRGILFRDMGAIEAIEL